jgi:hypothetical protein
MNEGGLSTATQARVREVPVACPWCGYDVRDLPQQRCPECGTEFTLEEAQEAAGLGPQIAYEKAAGRRKIGGFVITWLTVMFLPWRFAAQAVKRLRLRDAILFGLICNLAIGIRLVIEEPSLPHFLDWFISWTVTAWVYILAQATLLMLANPGCWRSRRRAWLWWVGVGGYTSAVMVAEALTAPPLIMLEDLVDLLRGLPSERPSLSDILEVLDGVSGIGTPGWQEVAALIHMLLWLAALSCCYIQRAKAALGLHLALILGFFVIPPCITVLYAAAIEYVGQPIYLFFDPAF